MLPLERRLLLLRRDVPERRDELFFAEPRDEEDLRPRALELRRDEAERDERLRPVDFLAVLLRERLRDPLLRERELELDFRAAIVASFPFQTRATSMRVALPIVKVAYRNSRSLRPTSHCVA